MKTDQVGKSYEAVGSEDNKFGFGLGKARKDAKPTTNIENLVNIPKDEFKINEETKPVSREQHSQGDLVTTNIDKKIVNVDKQKV